MMSDEEHDVIEYPSAKVGAVTRVKNEITKFIEDSPSPDPDDLERLKEKLNKKIKSFYEACDIEKVKEAPPEDLEEFNKWKNQKVLDNKIYLNKLDKIIIENTEGYENSSSEEEKSEEEDSAVGRKLIECFKSMQVSANLPQHEPEIFDGSDLTEYQSFELTFQQTIEKKCENYDDKYYYLLKYTGGEANTLVKSCHNVKGKKAYLDAKGLLKEKYGNEYIIAQQYLQKLHNWEPIKAENGPELNKFATFLTAIENLMIKMSSLNQLNSPRDIKDIIMKLPYHMRILFRNKSAELIDKNEEVNFTVLVKFVNLQAKQLNVPLFGDISDKKFIRKHEEKPNKYYKDSVKSKTFFTNDNEEKQKHCQCCKKNNHFLNDCYFFARKTHAEKEDFIKKHKLCYSCLENGNHFSKECKNKLTCKICEKQHPSCLHRGNNNISDTNHTTTTKKIETSKSPTKTSNSENQRNINLFVKGSTKIACPAIPVLLRSKSTNKVVRTYAALDSFSTASYMDNQILKKLNTEGKRKSLEITTIDDSKIKINTVVAEDLEISSLDKSNTLPLSAVYAKEKWPFCKDDSPSYEDIKNEKDFEEIPFDFINSKIGILIGMNEPDIIKPLQVVQPRNDGPYASRHKLGWALNGPICGSATTIQCLRTKTQEVLELEDKFDRVFNVDFREEKRAVDPSNCFTPDEQQWLNYVSNNCTKLPMSKKYEISLPMKTEVLMPNNYWQAYNRLQTTRKKLLNDDALKEQYTDFMKMMTDRGYMERVPEDELNLETQWFLTHHGVRHKRKGKLRIVFDCSLKFKGICLNDRLWKGPDLTNSLVGVLLRFRNNHIAVSGDIEKMFYNVQVPENDRTHLRFLWYENNNLNEEPVQYRLTVHLFGATSSPAVANFALKQSVANEEEQVVCTVNEAFYVDDLLASYDSEEKAINNIKKVSSSLQEASFNLTAFASNSNNVLQSISSDDRDNNESTVELPNNNAETRALGMKWNTCEDTLGFDVKIPDQPNTRRGVLSTIFSIYDPLFLAAPALIKAKRIFQITCEQKLGWDDQLPPELMSVWKQWKEQIVHLSSYNITRCYKGTLATIKENEVQLHIFTDGSEVAYGAVAYLRYKDRDNNINTSIVLSKSRLTPIDRKSLKTVPRIELNAAKLGVIVLELIREELRNQHFQKICLWTDSQSTLQYIMNETRQLQRFVANRVAYIRSRTDVYSWKFVPGNINPADQLSRGVTNLSNFINDDIWTKGPAFLRKPEEEWPSAETVEQLSIEDPEIKKKKFILATKTEDTNPLKLLMESTGDIHKLTCRIVAFLRLKEYLRTKEMVTERITVEEIEKGEAELWKYAQNSYFMKFIQTLQSKKDIPKKDPLRKLSPFIDNDGLLRVGGRLTNANLTYSAKHPIILHGSSPLVDMLIQRIHRDNGHLGRETVIAKLKEKYHIIKANKAVRQTIRNCTICKKVQGKPADQLMSDLPEDRVITDSPPFTNCGTDLFGPFYVSKGRGKTQEKRYGVIFTCLVSRATHLEITPGLDTDSYINALRRFMARRGKPKIMRSDNGTNLTSTDKELRRAIEEWNRDYIHEFCVQNHIDWKFQPPMSSHFGGVFERQIRSVRKIFNSLLHEISNQSKLTDDILNTLFAEIENIMNNIPLTVVTTDVNDDIPITPNSLLRMQTTFDFPPNIVSERDNYSKRTWKRIQYMADVFWTRFKKEYLPLINHRQKWNDKKRSLEVDDVVIVSDLSLPRNHWCLGRIIAVNKSDDNLVRSVNVLINKDNKGKQIISRPIHKLVLIESSNNDS